MDSFYVGAIVVLLAALFLGMTFHLGRINGADAVKSHCDSYQKFDYKDTVYSCNKVQKDLNKTLDITN